MADVLERVTTTAMVVNAVAFGVALAVPDAEVYTERVEHVVLAWFVIELAVKLRRSGIGRFVRNPWNAFDAALIGLSLVATLPAAGALRGLRAARLLRLMHVGRHAVQLRGAVALARNATH